MDTWLPYPEGHTDRTAKRSQTRPFLPLCDSLALRVPSRSLCRAAAWVSEALKGTSYAVQYRQGCIPFKDWLSDRMTLR